MAIRLPRVPTKANVLKFLKWGLAWTALWELGKYVADDIIWQGSDNSLVMGYGILMYLICNWTAKFLASDGKSQTER